MSMTSEQVELRFCDLCGRSIPDREFAQGLTPRAGEKLVGACCLAPLGATPAVDRASGASTAPTKAGELSRQLLPVAFALVTATVLGAAWWLDARARARDPGTRLAELEGRISGMQRVIDDASSKAALERSAVQTQVLAAIDAEAKARQADVAALREAMPKPDSSVAELRGALERLSASLTDLSARQGLVETGLATHGATLQRELAVVARSLVALRRASIAAVPAAGPAASDGAAAPKVEALPDKLGKRVEELAADNAGTRWEAVDELLRSGDKRVVPYILPRLSDSDPFVRRLVAEGLPKVADVEVCGALIEALADRESIVREAAHKALLALSGQRFPFDPEGSDTARGAQVEKWKSWWKSRA